MSSNWIDVSLENDDMEQTLRTSFEACYSAYVWTFDYMVSYWRKHKETPTQELVIAKFRKRKENFSNDDVTQKQSLVYAIQQAMRDFHSQMKISQSDQEGVSYQVTMPPLPSPEGYQEVTVNSRAKWRKYIQNFGGVSTIYGWLNLEGDWQRVFETEARRLKTSLDTLSYMCHSMTIREHENRWQVRFNYHSPRSKVGKRKGQPIREKSLV